MISALALCLSLCVNLTDDAPIAVQSSETGVRHSVLVTGGETYLLNAEGKTVWTYPGSSRDGWVLPHGRILLGVNKCDEFPGGAVVEVDRKGKRLFAFRGTQNEVDTVQPLSGGRILLTESGPNPRLLEIDRKGRIVVQFPLDCQKSDFHMQTRMARKLRNGHYLAPHLIDQQVKEYDAHGKVVWAVKTPNWPFTAIRLENGNNLIGCTRGNLVIEVDKSGRTVWQLTNDDLPREMNGPIKDACGVQRLHNGDTVVTAYGANGEDEIKLLQVTREKKLVWTLKTGRMHGIHTFQVLDDSGVPLR